MSTADAIEDSVELEERDLYRPRPDVPGHTLTTDGVTNQHGVAGFIVACSCGWTSRFVHLSALVATENRHRIVAAQTSGICDLCGTEVEADTALCDRCGEQIDAPTEHTMRHDANGEWIRVVCTCLWHGPWRRAKGVTVGRLLRSDENGHHYAMKRQEDAR